MLTPSAHRPIPAAAAALPPGGAHPDLLGGERPSAVSRGSWAGAGAGAGGRGWSGPSPALAFLSPGPQGALGKATWAT